MKKVFVLATLAIMMVACGGGGNKPYDAKKVNDLTSRMFSLTAADYPEVVKQADGILENRNRSPSVFFVPGIPA